jgi:hypothetical protein
MNMKKTTPILIFALLTATLFLATCDWEPTDTQLFDYNLRGTWKSVSPASDGYDGILEIKFNSITIKGYKGDIDDENKRPFKGITKETPWIGYSGEKENFSKPYPGHKGIIYIQTQNGEITIDYKYYVVDLSNIRLDISSTDGWKDTLKLSDEE